MKSQKSLVYLTVGIIVLLAIVVSLLPKNDPTSESESSSTQAGSVLKNLEQEKPQPPAPKGKGTTEQKNRQSSDGDDGDMPPTKITRVHKLLDNEDTHQDALKLAIELSKGNEEERAAALDVFLVVGGAESVKALIPMIKSKTEGEESAERADLTLRDLIQRNMFEDSRLIDEDTWMEIIDAQESEDALGEYLTLLTSFDVKEAVPVLLKLFDASDPSRKKLASEYMEFVAGGETIATKEQAEAWFQNYLKEQQEQEQE